MPDQTQNEYFRDLLTKIKDKESTLSQQIAQQKETYNEMLQNSPSKQAVPESNLADQNQQNLQEPKAANE